MAELIWVKSNLSDGRVALWERAEAHPTGEAFVAQTPVQVALTPAVERGLADGRLVECDAPEEQVVDPTHAALLLTRFEALTAKEIVEAAGEWSAYVRAILHAYEATHKNRTTVLAALKDEA